MLFLIQFSSFLFTGVSLKTRFSPFGEEHFHNKVKNTKAFKKLPMPRSQRWTHIIILNTSTRDSCFCLLSFLFYYATVMWPRYLAVTRASTLPSPSGARLPYHFNIFSSTPCETAHLVFHQILCLCLLLSYLLLSSCESGPIGVSGPECCNRRAQTAECEETLGNCCSDSRREWGCMFVCSLIALECGTAARLDCRDFALGSGGGPGNFM